MRIERIQSFKKLYQTRFNEVLSDKEATRKATKLQNLFNLIYGPRFGLKIKTENGTTDNKTNYGRQNYQTGDAPKESEH